MAFYFLGLVFFIENLPEFLLVFLRIVAVVVPHDAGIRGLFVVFLRVLQGQLQMLLLLPASSGN